MAVTVSVKVNSCKVGSTNLSAGLIYSTSGSMETSEVQGTTQNSSEITLTCTKSTATKCVVGYLKEPGTGNKFSNSLAICFTYQNSNGSQVATQEVLVSAPQGKISTVTWKMNGSTFNENSNDIVYTGQVTVDIVYTNTDSSSHGTVKNLTLFGYYVSKHGYKTSAELPSDETKLGSFDKPSRAFHRQYSNNWTTSANDDLNECTSKYQYSSSQSLVDASGDHFYYKLDKTVYPRAFTFVPPSDQPKYYIIIAFKMYTSGIGHIQILSGTANNFKDESNYWDAGWKYLSGTSIKTGLRYTVCAVYTDGMSPALGGNSGEYIKGNYGTNSSYRSTAYEYAQYVWFNYPTPLVSISWYDWNNGNPVLLKDGTGIQDLTYSIAKSSAATSITIPNVDNQIPAGKGIAGWYVGTSESSWNSSTKQQQSYFNSIVPNKDLYYAFVFETLRYTVTYTPYTGSPGSFQVDSGTTININPNGGTHDGHTTTYSKTITANTNITNATRAGYTFAGWKQSTVNGIITLTAQWTPNTVTVTYKHGDGATGSNVVDTPAYNSNYTLKLISDCNFTPSAATPYFLYWQDSNGNTYNQGSSYGKITSNVTFTAQWGSPWRKVKYIWIYDDADHQWKKYRPWI